MEEFKECSIFPLNCDALNTSCLMPPGCRRQTTTSGPSSSSPVGASVPPTTATTSSPQTPNSPPPPNPFRSSPGGCRPCRGPDAGSISEDCAEESNSWGPGHHWGGVWEWPEKQGSRGLSRGGSTPEILTNREPSPPWPPGEPPDEPTPPWPPGEPPDAEAGPAPVPLSALCIYFCYYKNIQPSNLECYKSAFSSGLLACKPVMSSMRHINCTSLSPDYKKNSKQLKLWLKIRSVHCNLLLPKPDSFKYTLFPQHLSPMSMLKSNCYQDCNSTFTHQN